MKKYSNLSEKSGVEAYEIINEGIKIRFAGGDIYRYTFRSAGKVAVLKMQELAEKGRGLSTYISQYVKDHFER